MTTFSDLSLDPRVLQAVTESGYVTPTPIQVQAIPHALEGRDVLGIAQTGTGKTGAFVLPMVTHLSKGRARARMPRSLVLAPDPRARRPGRRAVREILGAREALDGAADRRRQLQGPGQADRPRRRRADRHARPPARPLRARQADADRRADHGGRRGRPHARHGLHPRHRAHLQAGALHPADAVLLGHHGAGDHPDHRQFLHNPVRVEVARQATTSETIDQFVVHHTPAPQGHRRRREARGAAPDHPRRGRRR